jgi:hypothetical protein
MGTHNIFLDWHAHDPQGHPTYCQHNVQGLASKLYIGKILADLDHQPAVVHPATWGRFFNCLEVVEDFVRPLRTPPDLL